MPLEDLFVKNSTNTFLTYEGRAASSDVSGSNPEIDLQRGQQSLYGRVDYNLNAVYPSEAFLREIEDNIFVLNFVADAYDDLKDHYRKLANLKKIENKGKLKQIKAVKGWKSLTNSHHDYVSQIFQLFFETYASPTFEINTPEQFIKRFVEFLRDSKSTIFFTRTAFVESTIYNPLMSGLFIELVDEIKGDDVKRRKYYEDPNFVIFQNALKLFGFKSDKNHPWRIIADIESQPMVEYLQQKGLSPRTLFDEYFYKAYELDIDVMKQYFLEYYNTYDLKISKQKKKKEYNREVNKPLNSSEILFTNDQEYDSLKKYYDQLSNDNPTIQEKEIKFVKLEKTTEDKIIYPSRILSGTMGPPPPEPEPEPTTFGDTLSWTGRVSAFATSDIDEFSYLMCSPNLPQCFAATSGGTGRGDGDGIKSFDTDGTLLWHFAPLGELSISNIAHSNGSNDRGVFDIDNNGNSYATYGSAWQDSLTAPIFSGPTTTATATGTTHTVNIPSVDEGDLLVVVATFSANIVASVPSGDWDSRTSNPFGTGDSYVFTLLGATGLEGATVDFGTSASCDASWHVYKFAAGEWDDDGSPTAAEVVDLGSASETTGTSPNPGSLLPFEKNGEYALIVVCHVAAAETFSAYPTGFSGGSYTQSASTTIATAYKSGEGENPDAFTKSASASYRTYGIAVRTGTGEGEVKDDIVGGAISVDVNGNRRWYVLYSSFGLSGLSLCVEKDGDYVWGTVSGFIVTDGNGDPGVSGDEIFKLNKETGAIVDSWDRTTAGLNSSNQWCIPFGTTTTYDRVLFAANGVGVATSKLNCKPASNIEAANLWTLDKTTDFGISWSTIARILTRPDGGLVIGSGDVDFPRLFFISEDGTIESEYDLTTDNNSINQDAARLMDIHYDKFGHIYCHIIDSSGAEILKYDSDMNLVWRASDDYSQDDASAAAILADIELLDNGLSLAIGSEGTVYIGEKSATGVDDAYLGIWTQSES